MNIGQRIINYIKNEIQDSIDNESFVQNIILNYNIFVIWNEKNEDYFFLTISLTQHDNTIHNDNYNLSEDITTKINDIMNSKRSVKIESFPFYFKKINILYTMKMQFKSILKKSIIKAFERPRMRRHVDQDIISMIQDAGEKGMSASELNQRTQMITKEERNSIIKDLLENEIISLHFDAPNGRKKKIYRYE